MSATIARNAATVLFAVAAAAVLGGCAAAWFLSAYAADVTALATNTAQSINLQMDGFALGASKSTVTGAEKLAVILSGASAPLFWAGAICAGCAVPALCGVGAPALRGKGAGIAVALGALAPVGTLGVSSLSPAASRYPEQPQLPRSARAHVRPVRVALARLRFRCAG